MSTGAWLTKATVWFALLAYAIGAGRMLLTRGRAGSSGKTRWVWTIGCVFFLGHVACAFTFYHGWSHTAAYLETARQTGKMTGIRWGGGLFLNYLFAAAWLGDVLWWWLVPESFARRSDRITAIWHGFFFFMVFNGTVVFGLGSVRWFGAVIGAILAALWWHRRADIARRSTIR